MAPSLPPPQSHFSFLAGTDQPSEIPSFLLQNIHLERERETRKKINREVSRHFVVWKEEKRLWWRGRNFVDFNFFSLLFSFLVRTSQEKTAAAAAAV